MSGPLAFFTSLARRIQDQMLDAERLLELLVMRPTVTDKHDAKKLVATTGDVVMEDVVFSYDARKTVLKGVSFNGTGGKTIAFVGETGGGKTTCLNLLFRFHDVTSGSIKIDGQDIRDVTLSSLRSIFGIVPQVRGILCLISQPSLMVILGNRAVQ